jgi:hypothetical protein
MLGIFTRCLKHFFERKGFSKKKSLFRKETMFKPLQKVELEEGGKTH